MAREKPLCAALGQLDGGDAGAFVAKRARHGAEAAADLEDRGAGLEGVPVEDILTYR